jgi:UDP-N-acetylmuramyl pentapeptide phosphotransferase/UDP-N-acetylglucosamine-1-phosphate transferase
LLGIYELPLSAQYTFTILAIVGITNAFNLIDGIDGLAGGLGFMSLITLGMFLTMNGDMNTALIAFALAGGILAFLYFNFNPAKIFMGDTGSLVLGFVTAVLCIRLMQVNEFAADRCCHMPLCCTGIVLIPVFDTMRVLQKMEGKSPFRQDDPYPSPADQPGLQPWFCHKLICFLHGFVLIEVFWLRV